MLGSAWIMHQMQLGVVRAFYDLVSRKCFLSQNYDLEYKF
jgi:hypothetical protein